MADSTTLKRCTKCREEYPPTKEYFQKDKSRPGGLFPQCKNCTRASDRERSHGRLAYNREWHRTHPQNNKQYFANYRKNNLEKIRHNQRTWERENREHVRLKGRVQSSKRRAKKRANGGKYSNADIKLLLKSQGNKCWWCGEPLEGKYEIDHRIPLDRGGSNSPRNLCITHQWCNRSKGNKMPWEWSDRLI